jgi:hypothetical protein
MNVSDVPALRIASADAANSSAVFFRSSLTTRKGEEESDACLQDRMLARSRMTDNRNTRALVAAAAVRALVLGFSYGATFNGGCEQIKDAPFGCFEWWLSRYQTLIAMFGAIFVAWLTVQPVLEQLKLSSVQTAVALQQVHVDREKRLESWLKPELAALEKAVRGSGPWLPSPQA